MQEDYLSSTDVVWRAVFLRRFEGAKQSFKFFQWCLKIL